MMKLIDFKEAVEFNELRRKMNAEYIEMNSNIEWSPIDITLKNEGIEVDFSEITIDKNGLFFYNGKQVLVYIRDQYPAPGNQYKYHISNCKTIQEQKAKNRYYRYVVSTRTDGQFMVNIKDNGIYKEKNKLTELKICKNCLEKINHKGYRKKSEVEQNEIYENFSLSDIIDNTAQITKPKHTDKSAPLNQYSENFDLISKKLRKKNNWICEKCGRSFMNEKHRLHTHHIDRLKFNNEINNLKCLCDECHSSEPGHEHMNNGIAF